MAVSTPNGVSPSQYCKCWRDLQKFPQKIMKFPQAILGTTFLRGPMLLSFVRHAHVAYASLLTF